MKMLRGTVTYRQPLNKLVIRCLSARGDIEYLDSKAIFQFIKSIREVIVALKTPITGYMLTHQHVLSEVTLIKMALHIPPFLIRLYKGEATRYSTGNNRADRKIAEHLEALYDYLLELNVDLTLLTQKSPQEIAVFAEAFVVDAASYASLLRGQSLKNPRIIREMALDKDTSFHSRIQDLRNKVDQALFQFRDPREVLNYGNSIERE